MKLGHNAYLKDLVPLDAKTGLPDWIQLTPNSEHFSGRDPRKFYANAKEVVSSFNSSGERISIDIDHASEYFLGSTAAYGSIDRLEVRGAAEIWGHVEHWTTEGSRLLTDGVFHSVSPAFKLDPSSVNRWMDDDENNVELVVTGFSSVALTNKPNLKLRSLNGEHMDEKILAALGLNATAGVPDVVDAIVKLKTPDLQLAVPRADYDAVVTQLNVIKNEITEVRRQNHADRVDAVINAAIAAFKIPPASAAYHKACCSTLEGLERFNAFIANAPALMTKESVAPVTDPVVPPESISFNERQKVMIESFGLTESAAAEALKTYRNRGV